MVKLHIKPLSINACWMGRRFKTKDYKDYEKELLLKIKPQEIPEGPLKITLVFGFSTKAADWDNPIKPIVDILQKKLGFNDNRIYEGNVRKVIVKKGEEFIDFKIEEYTTE